MILADTSAWVDFLRGSGSQAQERLAAAIRSGRDVAATEPVRMELMAGARHSRDRDAIDRLMASLTWIRVQPESDFEAAAHIYTHCRDGGFTPRGLLDCMIAAVALRADAAVLSADKDFAHMARAIPLTLA